MKTRFYRNAEYYSDSTAGMALRKLMPPKRKPPKPRTWVLAWTNQACQHTKISPERYETARTDGKETPRTK